MVVFAIFFTLGVWLLQQQAALPDLAWAWLLPIFPLALFSPLLRRGNLFARSTRIVLLAAFACGLGFYHAAWQAEQRLAVSLPDEWQGRDIEVVGVVAELPRHYKRGLRFGFDVEQTLTPQASVPQHIYLSTYSDGKAKPLALRAGERWRLTLRLKQPHGAANPHGFDFEVWALERDIRAVGYVHNSEKLLAGHPKGDNRRIDELAPNTLFRGLGYRIEIWREQVRDKFNATLGNEPYAGILSALAIGDQNSIPPQQWQVFTRTGVNHLMSISGLHITMLASLAFAVAYWLWRRSVRLTLFLPARKAAALAALLTAIGYALLSGFAVPAQRTVYMVGAVAAALWLNRNFSLGQIVSIALLGVLIPDPWAVMSAGFWLSFGAVALILYVAAHRIGRTHWLVKYANAQWAMTIGLIPLLLGLFQQVSLVSPIANAVAIPLVSLVVVPLALLGAALPPYFSYGGTPLWLAHIAMGGALRLIVFDVGQGLAVAAQTRNHALLYDTGPDFSGDADSGNRILVPTLRALGIAKLDGLILSHDDTDHTGGTVSLMQAMPVGWVSSSLPVDRLETVRADPSTALRTNGLQLAPFQGEHRRCQDGERWEWDGVQFEILHPANDSDGAGKPHDNDQSCVLRISTGKHSVLLAGDIEKDSEMRLLKQHADKLSTSLLVVPHHGSRSSSGPDFVAATLPDYAVFTAGYRNRFGHPKEEILQRYADSGAELLRSDEDGAILVEMDAQGLQVERYRRTHRRYWTHGDTVLR